MVIIITYQHPQVLLQIAKVVKIQKKQIILNSNNNNKKMKNNNNNNSSKMNKIITKI